MSDRVHCFKCGKPVSGMDGRELIVRALVECPSCIERLDAVLSTAQRDVLAGSGHDCFEWQHGILCGLCGRRLAQ